MTTDAIDQDPADAVTPMRPWFLRLAERSRHSPLQLGTTAAVVLMALQVAAWLGLQWTLDETLVLGLPQLRAMAFFAVVIPFTPAGVGLCSRLIRRDLADLSGVLTLDGVDLERRFVQIEHVPRRLVIGATALFQLIALAGMEVNIGRISTALSPDRTAFDVYIVLMSLLVIPTITSPPLVLLQMAAGFHRLGREHTRIDLLELSALEPFRRVGVRTALVVPVVLGLAMLGSSVRTPPRSDLPVGARHNAHARRASEDPA